MPGALPFSSFLVAFFTSSTLILLAREMLMSVWGRRAMAASFIDEGLFRTLSKCSAQRAKIFSLSVMRVSPSALRTGDEPEVSGP